MTPQEASKELDRRLKEFQEIKVRETWDVIFTTTTERDTDAIPKTKAFMRMTRFAHQNAAALQMAGRIPFPPEEELVRKSWWFQHCREHHPELTTE